MRSTLVQASQSKNASLFSTAYECVRRQVDAAACTSGTLEALIICAENSLQVI